MFTLAERLTEIRFSARDVPEGCATYCAVAGALRDLLAEYDRLAAEVGRLKLLAEVGEAVGKLEDGGR